MTENTTAQANQDRLVRLLSFIPPIDHAWDILSRRTVSESHPAPDTAYLRPKIERIVSTSMKFPDDAKYVLLFFDLDPTDQLDLARTLRVPISVIQLWLEDLTRTAWNVWVDTQTSLPS